LPSFIPFEGDSHVPAIHDTAYPRLKSTLSAQELSDIYTPSAAEMALAKAVSKGTGPRICFLVLLKAFQRLGYFIRLEQVPQPIAEYISLLFGVPYGTLEWQAYDDSGTRRRHITLIREHFTVKPFDESARQLLIDNTRKAAYVKEDAADIINIVIEELIRQRYELPAYSTIANEVQRGRAEVNRRFYASVSATLGAQGCEQIDRLLESDQPGRRSLWQSLKIDPGAPTLNQLRLLTARFKWLKGLQLSPKNLFAGIPQTKVRHFALEARSLDAGRMAEMEPNKRYTLAAALIHQQMARCLDDLAEMFIKRMRKAHQRAQQALADYLWQHQARTDEMIGVLQQLLLAYRAEGSETERFTAISQVIADRADELLAKCEAYSAHTDHNYLPFLWRYCQSHRQLLFAILEEVELRSTSTDQSLERAIRFIQKHRHNRKDWLPLGPHALADPESLIEVDLSWVSDKWWVLVTGMASRKVPVALLNRRYFEMCVFTQLAHELKSGDLVIIGSDKYSDFRDQFVSPEEFREAVAEYCEQVGLPAANATLIAVLRQKLAETARSVDGLFPENDYLRIENDEPILTRVERRPQPEQLRQISQLLAESITPVNLLDVLADTEAWLNWTKVFGPLSGHESKLEDASCRYVTTIFSYGCNLGPSQVARSMKEIDRRQIAWLNQRHVTESNLEEAITQIINAYNKFILPRLWGAGRRASADGTKWDVYEQNLLSEYHIRYGGYGGIGYYHVADSYIALFSHFIPCGVYEAVYILDGLLNNQSDIRPDTLHADTHGQTATVFGLAYLLGIKLMPRIRNWKELKFFRPDRDSCYQHIDALFSEPINWSLITDSLDEMLRVAVSIKVGKLSASAILRKLGTYSRKNRLYLAFRELGRAVRTEFLLTYISNLKLRQVIQGAINKSEAFNKFAQWVAFGGHGLIAENNRDEQRKLIKYNHLVANCLIFHNVYAMTQALHQMHRDGITVSEEILQSLSPYLTEHINRFGDYRLDPKRQAPELRYDVEVRPYRVQLPE
jgi:TnpA family transposase